jgi:hypothetical protein
MRALHRKSNAAVTFTDAQSNSSVLIVYHMRVGSLGFNPTDDMNSASRRHTRASLVAMIVGGLLAVAPVFGPLGKTLHYLDDFIAERPQPMRVPDISFFAELLALIICPVGLLLFAISLVLFIRSGRRAAPRA